MIPEDYCSLRVKDLRNFLGNHDGSDLVVFKSRKGFIFEGYGIQSEEDGLVLSFNTVPAYCEEKGVFKNYSPYGNFSDFEYPFLNWMICEAVSCLKSEHDFVELYDVDDRLLGRLGFFDGFYVHEGRLIILKDNDLHSLSMDLSCSYSVDLDLVYYLRFCLC